MQVTDEMVRVADEAACRIDGMFRDLFSESDRHDILNRALTAALAAMWQPIETAPKDDRDILVGAWMTESGEPLAEFQPPEKWFCVISSRDDRDYRRGYRHRNGADWATHWAPLPPAPSQLSKRGDAERDSIQEA